jgi:glycosyltransferase involved in cell wall biosynthesis
MPLLKSLSMRAQARTHGVLNESRLISEAVGRAILLRAGIRPRSDARRLNDLLIACRRIASPSARQRLKREVGPWLAPDRAEEWRKARIGWDRYYREFDLAKPELHTSLLLKAPGPDGEKGVLYVSFEYNLMRLIAHHDARRLLAEYQVVMATSWSPTDYGVFATYAGLSDDPLFAGISNVVDVDAYRVMGPVVEPVPLMASDWIDPRFYTPRPHSEREIDILMVANFTRCKRHWLLFRALRHMRRDLRVTLIGIPSPDRPADVLRAEAKAFGAPQDLEIISNANIDVVSAYQCNARTSIILSKREGSCVATAECLFADTPMGLVRDAHVGSKAYINERTGVLLTESALDRELSAFLEASGSFQPRAWAMENITCHRSSDRLNAQLRDHSLRRGRPWTRDIAPLCWRYVPSYVSADDERRLAPALEELKTRHGVQLKKWVYRPHAAPGVAPS